MRQKIVAGNWKMQGNQAFIADLLAVLTAGIDRIAGVQCVLLPPYVYLSQLAQVLQESVIVWGAQDVSANEPGAYTGDIAAQMLRDLGCRYVLVGHSERRLLHHEDNTLVALKFAQAKQYGLRPILCVGETLEQRQGGQTEAILQAQIDAVLNLSAGVTLLRDAVIAYEPVWAIGTNISADPEQVQEVHAMIRHKIAQLDDELAQQLPILYGGSVKASNASALFAMPDVDGGLVGGAALDGDEFLGIMRCIN